MFPPFLVRLIARSGTRGHPLSCKDIARKTGRSPKWVTQMSSLTEWDNVTIRDAKAFLDGTGALERGFARDREFVLRSIAGHTKEMLTHIDKLPRRERAFLDKLSGEKSHEIAQIVRKMTGLQ